MTDQIKHYDETSDLSEVFVGRRIVAVEKPAQPPQGGFPSRWGHDSTRSDLDGLGDLGLLTLDNGTRVYVQGNDGGCACSAGCYELERLATADNIITSAKVIEPSEDEYGDRSGTYTIFVVTEAEQLNVAEFEGTDGNGYYGTGFHLAVVPVVQA